MIIASSVLISLELYRGYTANITYIFEFLLYQKCRVAGLVAHESNIYTIIIIVNEDCCSPNPITGQTSFVSGNQTGLR